ncbi:MAG TPA: hypothetical protein VH300_02560 [Thermoleophilaceae bacterium]|nr:hypothetical protein [Thermoleophilaceae bacterium]
MAHAPDLIEPVVGFRDWRVVDGQLSSRHLPMMWTEPTAHAECYPIGGYEFASELDPQPHTAPGVGCSCGIYAWHQPQGEFAIVDVRGVSGIVTLWGTLQAYADGVRAEYARVEALGVYSLWTKAKKELVTEIAASLGADVVDHDRLSEVSRDYGQPVPAELLPAEVTQPRRRFRFRLSRGASV